MAGPTICRQRESLIARKHHSRCATYDSGSGFKLLMRS